MRGTAFQGEGPASAKEVLEGSVMDERSEWLEPLDEVGDGDKLGKGQQPDQAGPLGHGNGGSLS